MARSRSPRERTPFGLRMLQARTLARMTQEQVCAALGCSQSTLTELENTANKSGLTPRFAQLYGVDPMWLATGEEATGDEARAAELFRQLPAGSDARKAGLAYLEGLVAGAAARPDGATAPADAAHRKPLRPAA